MRGTSWLVGLCLLVGSASVAIVACAKPHNQNPYWARADKLFLEFIDAPRDFAESDAIAQKNLERLQRIRRETALLDHPDWATRYHGLLVEFMQDGIGSLSWNQYRAGSIKSYFDLAAIAPGSDVSQLALKDANDLQKEQTKKIETDGEKVSKMLDELTTERERIGGPEWPLPALRRTPSK